MLSILGASVFLEWCQEKTLLAECFPWLGTTSFCWLRPSLKTTVLRLVHKSVLCEFSARSRPAPSWKFAGGTPSFIGLFSTIIIILPFLSLTMLVWFLLTIQMRAAKHNLFPVLSVIWLTLACTTYYLGTKYGSLINIMNFCIHNNGNTSRKKKAFGWIWKGQFRIGNFFPKKL